jgi:hypothetical protein
MALSNPMRRFVRPSPDDTPAGGGMGAEILGTHSMNITFREGPARQSWQAAVVYNGQFARQ